jgi:hypothetical protein
MDDQAETNRAPHEPPYFVLPNATAGDAVQRITIQTRSGTVELTADVAEFIAFVFKGALLFYSRSELAGEMVKRGLRP